MAFRIFKNKFGQAQAVEYAVVFFLVAAVVAGMSAYAKRAVQARIRGARNYMWVQVNGTYNQYHGDKFLPIAYEPYYTNTVTDKDDDTFQAEVVLPLVDGEGIFVSAINSTVESTSSAEVAAPRHAE